MFVGKMMTKKVITAAPEDTLKQAADLRAGNRIHRLPVVRDGKLVGIVSDSDIRNAAVRDSSPGGAAAATMTVGEIMTREVITVTPWDTVEDALLVLQKKRLGALPGASTRSVRRIPAPRDNRCAGRQGDAPECGFHGRRARGFYRLTPLCRAR